MNHLQPQGSRPPNLHRNPPSSRLHKLQQTLHQDGKVSNYTSQLPPFRRGHVPRYHINSPQFAVNCGIPIHFNNTPTKSFPFILQMSPWMIQLLSTIEIKITCARETNKRKIVCIYIFDMSTQKKKKKKKKKKKGKKRGI